jgi:hypothetical protein
MIDRNSRCFFAVIILICSFLYPLTVSAETPEIKKEQLVGKIWYVKKNFYILKEDGTYERQLRLRKKKVISSCTGKYTISGNHVEFEGFCPNSRDKFRWEISSIAPNEIKAVQVSFGVQLPEEGVRADKVFKTLE